MHIYLFIVLAFLPRTLAEEPLCSKFSYDEALLEKMIRNEFKFEQLQAKVEASLDRIEKFMKDSTDVIDQQKEKIGHLSEVLQSEYTDLRKNLTEFLSTPSIGFKATGVKNTRPAVGDVLVFPTVLPNSGNSNGYDASTGIFTAPVDGLYLFTTQMCMTTSTYITVSIMVNEIEIGRVFTYDNAGITPCNTGDAIAEVKVGQNVFIRIKYVTGSMFTDTHRLISFSGALLNTEY